MKRYFSSQVIVVLFIFAILTGIILCNWKWWKWKYLWSHVSSAPQTQVVMKGSYTGSGTLFGGSDDSKSYIFYTFIQTDMPQDMLEKYYAEKLESINIQFSGHPAHLSIHELESASAKNQLLHALHDSKMETFVTDADAQYLVLIVKTGRTFFFN